MTARPSLARFYGHQARLAGHSRHWAGPPEMVDCIAALASTQADHVVLDVGCGVGGPARRLASARGCRVVGVDVVPELLALGTRDAGGGGRDGARPAVFVAASALALPFPAATFDQLWCLGAVAHLPDLVAFAREAFRVLAAGGVACLTEAFWEGSRPPRFSATAPDPWRPVTVAGLTVEMYAAGFRQVERRPWPGGSPPAEASDAGLQADFVDGVLVPALVVAHR